MCAFPAVPVDAGEHRLGHSFGAYPGLARSCANRLTPNQTFDKLCRWSDTLVCCSAFFGFLVCC